MIFLVTLLVAGTISADMGRISHTEVDKGTVHIRP